jgi:hypothetical protein
MKEKLVKVLLEFKEKKNLIFLVIFYSFLIGFSETILYSIPISQFLELYSSQELPIVYMSLGLMMFLFGIFFDYIQKKCSPFLSIILPMLLFAFLEIIYCKSLQSGNSFLTLTSFVGSLLIVFFSLSICLILYYRLFTTNELKILLGIFFGTISIGGIASGLIIPFLLNLMETYDIMLLSAFVTGVVCVLLMLIKTHYPQKFLKISVEEISSFDTGSIKKSKDYKNYVYKVFVTAALSFFIFYVIDFIFNSEVQRYYTNQLERTIFYGYFNATLAGSILVFSFILYPLLYLKFGQKGAFLSFPIVIGALAVIGFLLNILTSDLVLIFYCIIVLELMSESFIDSTVLSSAFQFFQPLTTNIRRWAQYKNEMMVIPLSIAVMGFFLYLFEKTIGFNSTILFLLLVIFCTALIIIYFFFLEKKYIKFLVDSISKNIYNIGVFSKIGKDEIKLLEKNLFSQIPSEVIYSLNMLEKNDSQGFDLRLKEVMQHKNESVKIFCLKKVFDKNIKSLKTDVESILHKDKNPLIVSRALLTYGSVSDDFNGFAKCLDEIVSPHPDVTASKLSVCLLYGPDLVKQKALKNLHDLVFSSNENEQMIAAQVLKYYRHKEYLLKLLLNASINVKKIACTKCLIVDEDIMQALFDNIDIPELKTSITMNALNYPELTLKVAKARFLKQKLPVQKSIITILSLLKTTEALNFLKDIILKSNRAILKRLLKTLKATNQDHFDFPFELLLDQEMKYVLNLIDIIDSFGNPSTEIIFSLLAREIEIGKRICYLILSFIYPNISFSTVDPSFLKKNEDFQSNLEEVLLIKVDLESLHQLKEILLFIPKKNQSSSDNIKEKLLDVLNLGANAYIPSIRSAAIYTLGLLGFKECQSIVEEQEEDLDFLMPEFKSITLKLLRN